MMRNAAVVGFASVAMAAVAPAPAVYSTVSVPFRNTTAASSPTVSLGDPVYFTDKAATTTVPVTTFTTYCPTSGLYTFHGTTVTVSKPEVVTITACKGPCHTVPTAPVYKPSTETEHASTVTVPHTTFTTYCSTPTILTYPGTTITVSKPSTITVTHCKDGCKPTTVPVYIPKTETKTTESVKTITYPAEPPTTYISTLTKSTETPATVVTTVTHSVGTPEVKTATVPGVPVVTVSTVTKPSKPATVVTVTPSVHVPENPKETVPVHETETPKVSVPVYAPSKPANTTAPPAPTTPTVYDGSANAVSAAGFMAAVGAFVALAL